MLKNGSNPAITASSYMSQQAKNAKRAFFTVFFIKYIFITAPHYLRRPSAGAYYSKYISSFQRGKLSHSAEPAKPKYLPPISILYPKIALVSNCPA